LNDLKGKVAFVTGAARGQGRNHAIRLAESGAGIIAVDINGPVETVPYEGSTPDDFARTLELIEEHGGKVVGRQADVRDLEKLRAVVEEGVAELGGLDIVIANAGIASTGSVRDLSEEYWRTTIDINLTGVWNTVSASLPHLTAGGNIVLVGSVASFVGIPNVVHYSTAKHGLIGMMRTLAAELGPENIRVNTVCPTNVDTDMILNPHLMRLFMPEVESPTREDAEQEGSAHRALNAIPVPWIEADDVSNAILFLVSDNARYITGVALPVDAGWLIK
jgi:(+)-trans-carveol dehydrogenase